MKEIVIGFGLVWLLIWGAFGMFLRLQWTPHQNQLQTIIEEGDLKDYSDTLYTWKINEDAWIHAILSGLIAILIGLILQDTDLSDNHMKILRCFLITGTVLASLFHLIWILPIMILGDCLIMTAVLITFIRLVKKWVNH